MKQKKFDKKVKGKVIAVPAFFDPRTVSGNQFSVF